MAAKGLSAAPAFSRRGEAPPRSSKTVRCADTSRPGQAGEDLACEFLAAHGYLIRARNFRCRAGELDVVAERSGVTVFVEVKERRSSSHGYGFEHVTWAKRRRLLQAARLYAAQHALLDSPLRFDVVSVDWIGGRAQVRHDEGAFDGQGA